MNKSQSLAAVALPFVLGIPLLAQQDLADVSEKAEKSVVRITVETNQGGSLGSGFIVRENGILVTNMHVMAGARKAVAEFADGKSFEVKGTIHFDVDRDICICRIEGSGLPVLPASKSVPRKGERLFAIGAPRGLSFTLTNGVVSAIRDANEMATSTGRTTIKGTWIQVDVALSPGNSGGPLVNSTGEFVAMSTLASSGDSQNLNFGISAVDISDAVKANLNNKLTPLAEGVGKLDLEALQPKSALIDRVEVPVSAIEDYVAEARSSFEELSKSLRQDYSRINKVYSAMKRGKTFTRSGAPIERQIGRTEQYAFANEQIKSKVLKDFGKRVDELRELRDSIGKEPTPESLLELLMRYGPPINPRSKGSVGFLDQAVVLHAANEHDVVVLYDNVPYLIWVQDTSGLAIEQELTPGPVYVVGAQTMEVPSRGSIAVTVLNSVTRPEVEKVVMPLRTWTAKSGKTSVEATLIRKEIDNVVLKMKDGREKTVPISQLSDEDQEFLKDK